MNVLRVIESGVVMVIGVFGMIQIWHGLQSISWRQVFNGTVLIGLAWFLGDSIP